jgi:hypothetical protein
MSITDQHRPHARDYVRRLLGLNGPPQRLVSTVIGRVWRMQAEEPRGLVIYLSPWRECATGRITASPIRIRFPAAGHLSMIVAPGIAARICCADLEAPRRGSHTWTALGQEVDVGGRGARPQVPVIVHDRLLGRVVLDSKANVFIGQRSRGGMRYAIRIERTTTDSDPATARADVRLAAGRVRHFEEQAGNVRVMIVRRIHELYDGQWRHRRRRSSIGEVAGELQISELMIKLDGSLAIQLLAGDLFYGHWIEVALDPSLGLVDLRTAP